MKRVAIIGGGPAGCACAYFLQDYFEVTVFDKKSPLLSILPTGGGRCNFAYGEFDFMELAKNYPRGEKFLYSVFSKFSTFDTVEMFENLGIKSYMQDDFRYFPVSNSSKEVREKFLQSLNKVRFKQEEVLVIPEFFDFVVIATGGHAGYELARQLGHAIVDAKPALVGLTTKEDFSKLSGVCVNDALFTHRGVSGPKIYKISSIKSRDKFPYTLEFDFMPEIDFQDELNNNSQKDVRTLFSSYLPKSFVEFVLREHAHKKCYEIDGKTREEIKKRFSEFKINILGVFKDGETVTSGGVSLDEVESKTMMSKKRKNIYFIGEVLDIDGFCGGFNLQNCWSTAFVAAKDIIAKRDFL